MAGHFSTDCKVTCFFLSCKFYEKKIINIIFFAHIFVLLQRFTYSSMKVVRNRFLPAPQYDAINLFGFLFCRHDTHITPQLINHERIHTAQMREMLFLPFYLWYLIEWLIRLPMRGNAYFSLSMEREAYRHMNDLDYLKHRRHYAWLKMLRQRKPK